MAAELVLNRFTKINSLFNYGRYQGIDMGKPSLEKYSTRVEYIYE